MNVTDEEFAQQLWEFTHSDVTKRDTHYYYRDLVKFIRKSGWFDEQIEDALDRGFEQGRSE